MKKEKFKKLLEENLWLKKVPNALTICNSLCGFAAIIYATRHCDSSLAKDVTIAISSWIILFAMVFDALDGYAARLLKAASMHGLQMDSLADMVTFGTAPTALVAILSNHSGMNTKSYVIIWLLCSVYLGCAALRLATYNVHAILEKKSDDKFAGLPSPGAAAAICSLLIFNSTFHSQEIIMILPYYAAFLGLLMVSNIPFQHIGKWLLSVRRNPRRMLTVVVIIVCLAINLKISLLVIINSYVLSGPIIAAARFLKIIKQK